MSWTAKQKCSNKSFLVQLLIISFIITQSGWDIGIMNGFKTAFIVRACVFVHTLFRWVVMCVSQRHIREKTVYFSILYGNQFKEVDKVPKVVNFNQHCTFALYISLSFQQEKFLTNCAKLAHQHVLSNESRRPFAIAQAAWTVFIHKRNAVT